MKTKTKIRLFLLSLAAAVVGVGAYLGLVAFADSSYYIMDVRGGSGVKGVGESYEWHHSNLCFATTDNSAMGCLQIVDADGNLLSGVQTVEHSNGYYIKIPNASFTSAYIHYYENVNTSRYDIFSIYKNSEKVYLTDMIKVSTNASGATSTDTYYYDKRKDSYEITFTGASGLENFSVWNNNHAYVWNADYDSGFGYGFNAMSHMPYIRFYYDANYTQPVNPSDTKVSITNSSESTSVTLKVKSGGRDIFVDWDTMNLSNRTKMGNITYPKVFNSIHDGRSVSVYREFGRTLTAYPTKELEFWLDNTPTTLENFKKSGSNTEYYKVYSSLTGFSDWTEVTSSMMSTCSYDSSKQCASWTTRDAVYIKVVPAAGTSINMKGEDRRKSSFIYMTTNESLFTLSTKGSISRDGSHKITWSASQNGGTIAKVLNGWSTISSGATVTEGSTIALTINPNPFKQVTSLNWLSGIPISNTSYLNNEFVISMPGSDLDIPYGTVPFTTNNNTYFKNRTNATSAFNYSIKSIEGTPTETVTPNMGNARVDLINASESDWTDKGCVNAFISQHNSTIYNTFKVGVTDLVFKGVNDYTQSWENTHTLTEPSGASTSSDWGKKVTVTFNLNEKVPDNKQLYFYTCEYDHRYTSSGNGYVTGGYGDMTVEDYNDGGVTKTRVTTTMKTGGMYKLATADKTPKVTVPSNISHGRAKIVGLGWSTVDTQQTEVEPGTTVRLQITPDDKYQFNNNTPGGIELHPITSGFPLQYTFEMPSTDVDFTGLLNFYADNTDLNEISGDLNLISGISHTRGSGVRGTNGGILSVNLAQGVNSMADSSLGYTAWSNGWTTEEYFTISVKNIIRTSPKTQLNKYAAWEYDDDEVGSINITLDYNGTLDPNAEYILRRHVPSYTGNQVTGGYAETVSGVTINTTNKTISFTTDKFGINEGAYQLVKIPAPKKTITVPSNVAHGSVTISAVNDQSMSTYSTTADTGDTVMLYIQPENGYQFNNNQPNGVLLYPLSGYSNMYTYYFYVGDEDVNLSDISFYADSDTTSTSGDFSLLSDIGATRGNNGAYSLFGGIYNVKMTEGITSMANSSLGYNAWIDGKTVVEKFHLEVEQVVRTTMQNNLALNNAWIGPANSVGDFNISLKYTSDLDPDYQYQLMRFKPSYDSDNNVNGGGIEYINNVTFDKTNKTISFTTDKFGTEGEYQLVKKLNTKKLSLPVNINTSFYPIDIRLISVDDEPTILNIGGEIDVTVGKKVVVQVIPRSNQGVLQKTFGEGNSQITLKPEETINYFSFTMPDGPVDLGVITSSQFDNATVVEKNIAGFTGMNAPAMVSPGNGAYCLKVKNYSGDEASKAPFITAADTNNAAISAYFDLELVIRYPKGSNTEFWEVPVENESLGADLQISGSLASDFPDKTVYVLHKNSLTSNIDVINPTISGTSPRTLTFGVNNFSPFALAIEKDIVTHTVQVSAAHATVATSSATVNDGESFTTTITPASGYRLTGTATVTRDGQVLTNGYSLTVTDGVGTFTMPNVTGDTVAVVNTELIPKPVYNYTIVSTYATASPSTGSLEQGNGFVSTITPNSGYRLNNTVTVTPSTAGTATITIDSNTGIGTLTFTNIQGNATIMVGTEEIPPTQYDVTVSAQHATLSQASARVTEGSMFTTIITPASGYRLTGAATVLLNGSAITSGYSLTVGADGKGTLTISSVTGNIVATVNTELIPAVQYTAMISAQNASASPATATLAKGGSFTSTITPASGYRLTGNVVVNPTSAGTATLAVDSTTGTGALTFTNIQSNATIVIETEEIPAAQYEVRVTAANANVAQSSAMVTEGGMFTTTITPNSGYRLKETITVLKDGVAISSGYSFIIGSNGVGVLTISSVTGNIVATISTEVKPAVQYSLTIGASNATIAQATANVAQGGNFTTTITPNTGYRLTGVAIVSPSTAATANISIDDATGIGALTVSNMSANAVVIVNTEAKTTPTEKVTITVNTPNATATETSKEIEKGGEFSTVVVPNEGYHLTSSLSVEPASVSSVGIEIDENTGIGILTAVNVQANIAITVNVEANPVTPPPVTEKVTVTISASNASIWNQTGEIDKMGTYTSTITPNTGYRTTGEVTVYPATAATPNLAVNEETGVATLTLTNVSTNIIAVVGMEKIPQSKHTVVVMAANAMVAQNSAQVVPGGNFSTTIVPNDNYQLTGNVTVEPAAAATASIMVDQSTGVGTLTVNNIQGYTTIIVEVTEKIVTPPTEKVTVTVNAANSAIWNQTGQIDKNGTFTSSITPNTSYRLTGTVVLNPTNAASANLSYNETTGVTTLTLTNVTADVTATVGVERIPEVKHAVTINAANAYASQTGGQVSNGGSFTATITPNANYRLTGNVIVSPSDAATALISIDETTGAGTLTVSNITANVTVTVETAVKENPPAEDEKFEVTIVAMGTSITNPSAQIIKNGSFTTTITPNTKYELTGKVEVAPSDGATATLTVDSKTGIGTIRVSNVTRRVIVTIEMRIKHTSDDKPDNPNNPQPKPEDPTDQPGSNDKPSDKPGSSTEKPGSNDSDSSNSDNSNSSNGSSSETGKKPSDKNSSAKTPNTGEKIATFGTVFAGATLLITTSILFVKKRF